MEIVDELAKFSILILELYECTAFENKNKGLRVKCCERMRSQHAKKTQLGYQPQEIVRFSLRLNEGWSIEIER